MEIPQITVMRTFPKIALHYLLLSTIKSNIYEVSSFPSKNVQVELEVDFNK